MTTLKQVERPNEKHLKILAEISGATEQNLLDEPYLSIPIILAAMQVLQDEIDQLQPVTETEKSIRELVKLIHESGLDEQFVNTILDAFISMAGLKGVIESKNQ